VNKIRYEPNAIKKRRNVIHKVIVKDS
jgi:hypothetical protein